MVDPIEVKLEEIDAKIDQIAYAPKYKATYEISEMMKSKASGGFLDTVIKGMTGKGAMGGIVGGIAAGGAAGGVLVLADMIKDLTKQSKILANVQSNLTKSVSLLVDLVLLPFLPLIYGGIIMLYSSIIGFGTWWKDVWDTLKKEGLIGLVKLGLQWSLNSLLDWEKKMTEWLFSDKTIFEKVLDIGLSLKDMIGDFEFLPGYSIKKILQWIFGDTLQKNAALAFSILADLASVNLKIISALLDFIFGEGKLGRNVLDFTINLIQGAGDWLWKILEGVYNVGADAISKAIPSINLPVNAGSGSSGSSSTTTQSASVTNNFYGLQPEGLVDEVKNILRQFSGGWLNL